MDDSVKATHTVRIAAIADIHCGRSSHGELRGVLGAMGDAADIVLLGGDLTNYGVVEEAKVLVEELTPLKGKPVFAVLGNHDVESNQQDELVKILRDTGVTMLDGDAVVVHGVGIAGVKGFCGGFGRRALEPWGEATIKQFVRDSIDESLKLESALARLRDEPRVVLVHYAPIHQTVVGEPDEIIPFLGSSRLEEPINRYRAAVVFHGHAHHGSPEGKTKSDVPVFNVAFPLMKAVSPQQPFRVFEVTVQSAGAVATQAAATG